MGSSDVRERERMQSHLLDLIKKATPEDMPEDELWNMFPLVPSPAKPSLTLEPSGHGKGNLKS